ncbi:inositol monophosphatase family protein [Staphylothermus hellenicus]|uniref:Inositol monophosphatase n=1 Tax=Staphylothermus hellenicus (strain DSM 12710 / JCM 10830 / BK20S6-10-b1 / P8) TaxID=591019 RepID=D7DB38_STAHD|nr:inositol monophosphatase family protein [Staphylothermus hellenicus]ADI31385.1 inositol monophosphatase [Staphylothermus hellenicus DSM 12710]
MRIDEELERIAFRIAGESAGYLRDLYGLEPLSSIVGRGASGDTTRKIDALVEEYAIELLRGTGLDLYIVSEEAGIVRIGENHQFIVLMDPLDGSLNYTLGIPGVAVSLVFYDINSDDFTESIAGAVANVFLKEIYSFDKSNVYVNRVRVEKYYSRMSGINVVYTNTAETFRKVYLFMKKEFGGEVRLRVIGSAALESVYAALGRIDLFLHNTGRLRNLDVAGGVSIAKRLGVPVLGLDGKKIICSPKRIEFIKSLVIGKPGVEKIVEYFKE